MQTLRKKPPNKLSDAHDNEAKLRKKKPPSDIDLADPGDPSVLKDTEY
tara:strand:- start:3339 stop:3482 length:144 start_codon:yes stop_codon:yes gene_type:complete